jgi:hypothetical protein
MSESRALLRSNVWGGHREVNWRRHQQAKATRQEVVVRRLGCADLHAPYVCNDDIASNLYR